MDKQTPQPLISVIIPSYNIETYIVRAIKSALEQIHVSVEVIVVDDKSTDGTVAAARTLSDPRLTIIELSENGGPSKARNAGLAAAKGDWVALLDGDDCYQKDRLATLLSLALRDNADIVVDNLIVNREIDNSRFPMFSSQDFQHTTVIDLAHFIKGNQNFLGGYTLGYLKPLFRTEFLKTHSLRYSEDIRIGEDYIFLAECLANEALCLTAPYAGYHYTVRAGSISYRLGEDAVHRIEAADQAFLDKYKLNESTTKEQRLRERRLRSALAFTRLVEALKSKDFVMAMKISAVTPYALPYLWRPIWVRVTRLFGLD